MKANFALTLSFTGIRLLHRAAGGWRFVGDVALDNPDLDAALASLRRTALELEPAGLRTKLVLPDTQIRYLTIDSAQDDLDAAARSALEGATPYPVSELVFDLSPDGDRTHVAAIARETLAEAEAFATQHRLAPISVVGIPDGEAFLGEPFFGPTDYASKILGPGQSVEPDGIAVVELGPLEWPDGPVVTVTEDTPVADEEPALTANPAPPEELETPQATDDPWKPREDLADAADGPDSDAGGAGDSTTPADAESAAPPVGFASRRKSGSDAAPRLGGVSRRFDPAAATPPGAPAPIKAVKPASLDDDVPNPPPEILAAFLSRRRPKAPEHDPRDSGKGDKPAPPPPKAQATLSHRPAMAGVPSMAIAADTAAPELRPQDVPRPKSKRQRMTVFGTRDAGNGALVGGKPRFLGLALTAVLLVFLAGVAAWATVFIDDGIARFFGPRTPAATLTAEEPAPEPEPASQSRAITQSAATPDPPTEVETMPTNPLAEPKAPRDEDLQTASLDPELGREGSLEPEPDVLAEPEGPKVFDPLEAAAQYAVTGIWTIPPDAPTAPGLVDVEDLYVTSIDPPGESVDALALLPGTGFGTDEAPLSPADPAPPGMRFDLDERGLVRPTADGALSQDGILVHLGTPPVVPPDAPQRSQELPEDVHAAVRQEASGTRPRTRPENLVENTERQQLGGHSRSELAEFRPSLRPETLKQAEEADVTPTAQAVASSVRPSNRPGNIAQIVAQAVETAARAAEPAPAPAAPAPAAPAAVPQSAEPEQVASVAPRAVVPAIPSATSVAREATVRNAINLRRINLMGVYGSPSNRRALVRLSNGRYMKVKVGDRIDGGRVSAIGDSELSYVKGNRNIVLTMPRT